MSLYHSLQKQSQLGFIPTYPPPTPKLHQLRLKSEACHLVATLRRTGAFAGEVQRALQHPHLPLMETRQPVSLLETSWETNVMHREGWQETEPCSPPFPSLPFPSPPLTEHVLPLHLRAG